MAMSAEPLTKEEREELESLSARDDNLGKIARAWLKAENDGLE